MPTRRAEISPLVYARIAGALVFVILACAGLGMMYIPSTLFVPGDATATADNIRAAESLFRMGMVSDGMIFLVEIVLVVVLYLLFEPVSRALSLIAAAARLAMTVIQGVNLLASFAVLLVLSGAGYLAVFGPAQLDALALLFLDAHDRLVYVWEAFFALHCFVLAYLVFASRFVPRVLGVFMALAASGYLLESVGNVLAPSHAGTFTAVVGVTAFVGEFPLFLWLLFKGVDVEKWHERAAGPTAVSSA